MTTAGIQKWLNGSLLALACWWGVGSAGAQVRGLYKDGVLVEPLEGLLPAPGAPEDLTTVRLHHPAQELSAETVARNLAGKECASVLGKLHDEIGRLHAAGRNADAGERQQLAALRAEAAAAADKLIGLVAAEEAKLRQFQLPPEILERHAASLAIMRRNKDEFLAAIDASASGDPGKLAAAAALVERFKPKREAPLPPQPTVTPRILKAPQLTAEAADALLAAKIPAIKGNPAPRKGPKDGSSDSPEEEPVPVLQGGPPEAPEGAPPVPGDLTETVEIQFTPEITAKAAVLGNSPLAIYEFVRNKVEFQPYLGSRKGAAGTLAQLAGNDTDQAALLMALLRVSGIPCRYVRGTVELTPAQAAGWLGVDDPGTAGNILTTAGLDGVNIISGSTVTAIRCTRVWVEAYIPYTNYRGVPNDNTGKTWVPLDPAFQGTVINQGEDVLAAMAFNTDAFLADYISTFHALSPLEKLRADIQLWLDSNDPGKSVASIERTIAMDQQHLGMLPGSVPGRTLAVASRFSELEDSKRYKVRFHLYDDFTDFIDHTINLSDLAGRKLTIDYIGANAADQETIDSYGGIYQTPPNLVSVKPRLKLDGVPVVTSSNAIDMGRTHSSDMQFIQPAGDGNSQPWVSNDITAGNTQAIAFNSFFDLGDGFLFGGNTPAMGVLEMQLHGTAANYLARVDAGIQKAGRLMRAVTTQEVSEAIVESAVSVTTSFGVPVTFEWTGLTVDADRRIIGGPFVANGDSSKEVPFMLLAGYDGSIMENRVFEDTYGQQAVSTVKILELSNDAGIPVYTFTSYPASGLNQPSTVINAVNTGLLQGRHIIIPRDPITVGGWHGTGYVYLEPATGAAAYVISGGINGTVSTNGGATIDVWPITLDCVNPWLPVTGTIIPDGFSNGDTVCADGSFITYTVTLYYYCGFNQRTFGPTSHTIPIEKNEILRRFGPGQYTIRIPETWVSAVSFLLLPYDEFTKGQESICWWQDGKLDLKTLLTPDSCRDPNFVMWQFLMATGPATMDDSGVITFGNGAGRYQIWVLPKDGVGCDDILPLNILKLEFTKDEHVDCWQQSGTFNAKALLTPESTQDDELVNWTINGSPNATIDPSGVVTFAAGPGTYTVTVAAKAVPGCSDTLTLALVGVESLLPDKGEEIDDGDGNPDTKTFVVCASTTPGDIVTVTATPKPPMDEADLPPCWNLSGGTGSSKLQRTLDQTASKEEVFTCLEKKTTVIVFKLELITPAGNPVSAPSDSGDGKNEFTFDSATPGVLEIAMKVKVTPAGIAGVIKNDVLFKVGAVGGSTLSWKSPNNGGKPIEAGDDLVATAVYTGLPSSNSAFGSKVAQVDYKAVKQDEALYEVFFSKDATNHPGGVATDPNWFYYWQAGQVCGIDNNCRYDPDASFGYTLPGQDSLVRLGPDAPELNTGPETYNSGTPTYSSITVTGQGKGIQCVAETIQHELHHLTIYDAFHSRITVAHANGGPNNGDPDDDPDGETIPNVEEPTYDGVNSNPNDPDTFNMGGGYAGYGDNEVRCRKIELNLAIPIHPERDWADPGCQSKNKFGP